MQTNIRPISVSREARERERGGGGVFYMTWWQIRVNWLSVSLRSSLLSLRGRGRRVIPSRWTENRKGAGTSSGESGAKNLEAEIIRSRGWEITGGCVKLKTVTEIRRSSARDTFIAFILYWTRFFAGRGSSGETIETEVCCGQLYWSSSTILYATMASDRGNMQARKDRIAVVKAWQNEWLRWPISLNLASVERYFRTELIRRSW